MRAQKPISRLAQLVRTNAGSVSGIASAYRVISLTALAWLVALEAYRFANKTYAPDVDTRGSTKTPAAEQAPPVAADASDSGASGAGGQGERHAQSGNSSDTEDLYQAKSSVMGPALGSSTDPRLISSPAPGSAPVPASAVATTGVPVLDIKAGPVSVVVASPADFVPAVQDQGSPIIPAPTVSSVLASGPGIDVDGNGDLNAGHVVTLTVTMSDVVTVAGGTPALALNNGGTASYVGGSGTDTLIFNYTVAAGQDTGDLAVSCFNLNGATVQGTSGDNADLSGAVTNPPGTLQIDTTAPVAPAIASIVPGGSGGNHWVLTGTAEPNSTVTIFDGAAPLAVVTASGSGAWTYTTIDPVTDSSVHTFTATATDAAGNSSVASMEWIEGSSGNDVFGFGSAAALMAPAAINGNGGADTISTTAAVSLDDGAFAHVSGVQSLRLTGASTITLGGNAASAGLVNVATGSGATSITDSNGVALNVDATTLANNTALTLIGSAAETVSGLIGNITAGSLTGALTVTTGDAADNTHQRSPPARRRPRSPRAGRAT